MFKKNIQTLLDGFHFLGPHSDQHLLYCDWTKRDSTLVTRGLFLHDFNQNLKAMRDNQWLAPGNHYMIPPYEWWNDIVAKWANETGISLLSFTPGTGSNADYTWPEMGTTYKSSEAILQSIKAFEAKDPHQLNGMVLLVHVGTDPRRKDKFYEHLGTLIVDLKAKGYQFKTVDQML